MCLTEYDEEETMQMFMDEGEKRGEDKLARLINALISAGRSDDITIATNNRTQRTALYREFDIA